MKLFINYVPLKREEVNQFVFNDSCNNRWPTADSFHEQAKKWEANYLDPQQQIIKDYIKHLASVKHSEESFIIRIVNEINTKIKALTSKNRQGGYWLGADKLPEEIEVEIKDLKKALDFPEYQGFKEQLVNWYKDPEKTLDQIRKHFADYPIHQWFEIYSYLRNWINDQNDKGEPFKEVEKILDEWVDNTEKIDEEFSQSEEIKSLQIQLLERNETFIKFQWILPNTILKIDEKEYKSKIFPNLKHYFFYFDGEWYEILDWEQKGWNGAELTAEKSIFYNGYWWLLKSGANGYIHHSPVGLEKQNQEDDQYLGEFCNCFETDAINSRNNFVNDYELRFGLYKMANSMFDPNRSQDHYYVDDGGIKMVIGMLPKPVKDIDKEAHDMNWIAEGGRRVMDFLWGTKQDLYLLLNEKLEDQKFTSKLVEKSEWKRVGGFNKITKISELTDETLTKFLENKDLLKSEMRHPLTQHIRATIMWRGEPVWNGSYGLLHREFRIIESVSPSGSVLTIEGSGIILAQISESITSFVGVDSGGFKDTVISIGTSIAVAYATGGVAIPPKKAPASEKKAFTVDRAWKKGGIGAAGSATSSLLSSNVNYSETQKSMTVHEFKHKYTVSGVRPLSLQIEYNQDSFNRYQKNHALHGINRADAFNVACLGESLLNNAGFLKVTIESWNLPDSVYDEWFKRKIEEGIFLEKIANETYLKQLPKSVIATSQGGIVRATWNEITSIDTVSIGSGWDNISHQGRGFWVYKRKEGRENHITVEGGSYQGTNLLSWLITTINNRYSGFIVEEKDDMWIIGHPNPAFSDFKVDIPDKYKYKEISQGESQTKIKACQINYRLKFFTGGNDSREDFDEGTEINATHMIIHKLVNGNQSKLVIEIKGQHVLVNKVSNPENIPLAQVNRNDEGQAFLQPTTKPNFNINNPTNNSNPITMVPNSVISSGLGEIQVPLEVNQETQTMEQLQQQQGVQFNVNIDTQTQIQAQVNTQSQQENNVESVSQEDQNQNENN
jgi:hypothetical protein